ncbi:hypothetical protein ACQ4PT_042029 [Festuca glaucescens]
MAVDGCSPRDGKQLEVLRYYNPLPGLITDSEITQFQFPEVEQGLSNAAESKVTIGFTPNLISMNRGMQSTMFAEMAPGVTVNDLYQHLNSTYEFLCTSPHPYSLYSYPVLTLEAATDDAARQAIEYMEKVEKKVPANFKDVGLEKEKRTVELLRYRPEKKNERLIRKSNQLIQTAVACDIYIENVTESTHHIKNIILDSLAPNCTITRDKHHASLLEIQAIVVGLSQRTTNTLAMLKAAGPAPYGGEETIEDDQSSGSYDSDKAYKKFDAYEFDSDGRPTDYDV